MRGKSYYRPDIDGLRAIAVLAVLAFHAFPEYLPGGFVGVDIFFVISGYLISGLLLDDLHAGRFSFTAFYARRIRRIFPALVIVLAAVFATGWFVFFADDFRALGRHIAGGGGFLSNFLLWNESSYFDVSAERKPLLHLWSLAIEEQFYLLWPVLLLVAFRWRRGPLTMAVVVGVASFIASLVIVRIDRTPAFYAPWYRVWELLAGAALACVQADATLGPRLREVTKHQAIAGLSAALGVLMIVVAVALLDSTRVFPGLWVVLPVGGTVLLLVSGASESPIRRLLSLGPITWVGLISYPLYLWHWPLLALIRMRTAGVPPASMRLLGVLASVALAVATYRLIERPARFGALRPAAVPVFSIAMVVMTGVGAATYLQDGFVDRAINRSDSAHFVAYYEGMKGPRIASAYRAECDFMDWASSGNRLALDPSCTSPGASTYFLWGDSYAQALSLGIREQLPAGTALAQVATSACPAQVADFNAAAPGRRCERANVFAMESIARLRPTLVIVAQMEGHTGTDWAQLRRRVTELGGGRLLVVGPFPRWRPSLPSIYASRFLVTPQAHVDAGLDRAVWADDRRLAAALSTLPGLTYLSLIDQLCDARGCLAVVPGGEPTDLMTFDSGHLTPLGSSYVGRVILKGYLQSGGEKH